MEEAAANSPHVIGLTGSFGSGCSYLTEHVLVANGYVRFSLSDVLGELYQAETGHEPATAPRRALQDFGDRLRRDKGVGFLAEKVARQIKDHQKAHPDGRYVIDSIRNPAEVHVLRRSVDNFFLFGVYADREVRWPRVRAKYEEDRRTFDEDDKNDRGEERSDGWEAHGQRVSDCFAEADVVTSNEDHITTVGNTDFERLQGRILQYADLVAHPLARKQAIRENEVFMAMAYAASQRSSCIKRRVGAIIVDEYGNVIASGFNEVAPYEKPCKDEYKMCYRDWLCDDFFGTLEEEVPAVAGNKEALRGVFRKRFKILDYCRALHAEEHAILSLARNGRSVPLEKCTLYTTTYPCRLCANKISDIGIKRIVYLEPYPDRTAKVILRAAGVNDEFFEGITFRAYFRIYGERK